MVYARVGLLRTLPPPDPRDVSGCTAPPAALGIDWPAEQLYPDFIRVARPRQARPRGDDHRPARGCCAAAGYSAFDGEVPGGADARARWPRSTPTCTAPLRRLVDRYAGEVCVALCAGDRGARRGSRAALPSLPQTLQDVGPSRAPATSAAVLDLVEAAVLAPHGRARRSTAVVVDVDDERRRARHRAVSPTRRSRRRVVGDHAAAAGRAVVRSRLVEADVAHPHGALRVSSPDVRTR